MESKCTAVGLVLLQVIGLTNPYIWEGIDYSKTPRKCNSIVRGNKAGVPYIYSHVMPRAYSVMNFTIFPVKECRELDAVGVEAIACDSDLGPYVTILPNSVVVGRAQPPPYTRGAAVRIIVFCKHHRTAARSFQQFLLDEGWDGEKSDGFFGK